MKLYRLMKTGPADGKPRVGTGSMMLGVRPSDPAANKSGDVPAAAGTDLVRPGDGGLSCFDSPAAITIPSGKLSVWSIETDDLPAGLIGRAAGAPHYQIEPTAAVTLDDFQRLLAGTRDLWRLEGKGATP